MSCLLWEQAESGEIRKETGTGGAGSLQATHGLSASFKPGNFSLRAMWSHGGFQEKTRNFTSRIFLSQIHSPDLIMRKIPDKPKV